MLVKVNSSCTMAQEQPQELLLDRILCQAQALDVAIAGAGPIGILTAIAIRRKLKRTIHIFEGAAPGKGAARPGVIVISPNGMKALDLIDNELPRLILEAGHKLEVRHVVTFGANEVPEDGKHVGEEEKYGWPSVAVEWSMLQKILLIRLPKDVELHYDREVSGFEEDAEGVSVCFRSRTNVLRAHVLIAADGMASTVRQRVTGDADHPIATTHVSWEAVISSSLPAVEAVPEHHMTIITDPSRPGFFARLISLGDRTYWQVTVEDTDGSLQRSHHGHSGLGLGGCKDTVMGHVEGHPALAEAVRVTREGDIFERLLHYRRPVASHTSAGKRVLLVGDAAHGMHPRLGQGANMGFEDAYQVAACLASWGDDDPVKALREYESSRVPRVNRVQELANTLGGVPACEAMRRAKEAREWVFGGFAGYTAC